MKRVRVLSFNTWHGLDPHGVLFFASIEDSSQRRRRRDYQIQLFKEAAPDLILLQEVSPCAERSHELAERLGYLEVHQSVIRGVKLWGWGFPTNLDFGISILAKPPADLEKLEAIHLTRDPVGVVSDEISFQLSEWRSAIVAKWSCASVKDVLLVNTHLHHGFGLMPSVLKLLVEKHRQKKMDQEKLEFVTEDMQKASLRRLEELVRLFKGLQKYKVLGSSPSESAILGGDLNVLPGSEELKILTSWGFTDMAEALGSAQPTWDSERNPWVAEFSHQETEWVINKWELPVEIRNEIHTELNQFLRQRRLDYILKNRVCPLRPVSCKTFGDRPSADGIWASDHFGVLIDFEVMK